MTKAESKTHWTHWVISVLLFLWNLLGSVNFLFQFDPTYVASLPVEYQTLIENRPIWATLGFAIAVIGGAIGAILLMVRSKLAFPAFSVATIGAIVTIFDGFSGGGLMQIATTMAAAIYAKLSAGRTYPVQT